MTLHVTFPHRTRRHPAPAVDAAELRRIARAVPHPIEDAAARYRTAR